MTNEELLSAGTSDAHTCYAHFQTVPSDALVRLQLHLEIEQVTTSSPARLAFNGGRLALIKAVLQQRAARLVEPESRD